jgi:hypothetical protein
MLKRQRSRYSDQVTGWPAEESLLNSRKKEENSVFSRRPLGTQEGCYSLNTEGSFPRQSGRGVKLKIHINMMLRSKMRGVVLKKLWCFRGQIHTYL